MIITDSLVIIIDDHYDYCNYFFTIIIITGSGRHIIMNRLSLYICKVHALSGDNNTDVIQSLQHCKNIAYSRDQSRVVKSCLMLVCKGIRIFYRNLMKFRAFWCILQVLRSVEKGLAIISIYLVVT